MKRSAGVLMRWVTWFCALAVFAHPVWARTDAATAEALMRKSGMWEQLADVAPEVLAGTLAGMAPSGIRPSEAEVARLSRAVDAAFSVHRLRSACLGAVSRDLDIGRVAALNRWYDRPVGRTITKLEEALSRRGDQQAILEQGAALLGRMADSRRRALDEIVLATRSAELMTELTISTFIATQQGIASISPSSARPSASEMKARLDAQRQQLIRTFSALSLAGYAVAFSAVPTADLAAYVDFLKSEAGRHFRAVATRAYSAAMIDAATQFGRALPGSRDKANT